MSEKFEIQENLLLEKVKDIVNERKRREEKLLEICKFLEANVPHYNWVGFYLVDRKNPEELVLGPFVGEPTEHVKIPFGAGICGQAAEKKLTFIVQDVSKEADYLSCSPRVKAEIVVPIFGRERKIIGELDIDSHYIEPFTQKDRIFLENVCKYVSELF